MFPPRRPGSAAFPKQRQTTATVFLPAPVRGINAIGGIASMVPEDCIYAFNMYSGQYGLKVREGYRLWAENVGVGGIRTIIPYVGTAATDNRLFAAASNGIYDVTTGTPVLKYLFLAEDDTSGYGVWTTIITSAGKFILYTDESYGYFVYTESTDTWTKIAMGGGGSEINGVDPATFCFVMIWKSRVWFIQRNTGLAWYLTTGSLYGTATSFTFGTKFKYGGNLQALYNWTVDGGEGVDDYLVAVSEGGDVTAYKGTDPSSASTFDQRGLWYIGPPPAGRRIGGSFGGELFLLSSYGLIPASKLLSGQIIQESATTLSARITPLVNAQMRATRNELGWEVRLLPEQNLLAINTPKRGSLPYMQFMQAIDTKSWSVFRDIPYYTGDAWDGQFYIGTTDGRVIIHTGNSDNADTSGADGVEIEWSILTSFQDHGLPGMYRIPQFIRPVFIGQQAPEFFVQAVFDYNLLEVVGTPESTTPFSGSWDVAVWDEAVWGGQFLTSDTLHGAGGIGRAIAVALKGVSVAEITLVRFDLMFSAGWSL